MEKTIAEVLTELKRELKTRKRVYPNWVNAEKLNANTAQHRIECIEEAIRFIETNKPKPIDLFSQPPGGRGMLFLTKSGKKVRTYYKDGEAVNGKVKCYVLDDNMQLTGEKILCEPGTMQHIGFID